MKKNKRLCLALVLALLLAAVLGVLWLTTRQPPPQPSALWLTVLDSQGQEQVVELEEFLQGVVAAEMPASFRSEALTAQGVAARTYLYQAILSPRHGNAAVCCDSTCCQAWLSPTQRQAQWGGAAGEYERKISAALAASQGQILLYQGEPALTVFCSACGGCSEAAGAVWGRELPYLQPRPCAWCRQASRYSGVFPFTLAEAGAQLGVSGEALRGLSVTARTPGQRIAQAACPDATWSGTELRAALGLNSTACTWLIAGESIVFFTLGYGHGVGLCQYGAEGAAAAGVGWREIVAWYYPGCELGGIPL